MSGKKRENFIQGIFFILLFFAAVVTAAILKISGSVLLPLTIAILFALVFEPVVSLLNRKFKIPWFAGILLVIIVAAIGVTVLGSILFSSLKTILLQYPKYEERFLKIYEGIAQIMQLPFNADYTLFENLWGQLGVRSTIQSLAFSLSNSFISFLQDGVVVILFIVFFLLELRFLREKVEYAFENRFSGKITLIISDIISQITRYLSVKFFISLLTGVLVYFGMLLIGLDFPVVWGFISFVLNFIPNFGSIAAGVLAAVFSLVQFWPEPGPVISVIVLMLGVNMVLGNFVEPKVQGKNLGLSPFVIVAALSVWGWIWGFAGLILAVPMMVILKIVCENVLLLHPLSVLMGSYPPEKKDNADQDIQNTPQPEQPDSRPENDSAQT